MKQHDAVCDFETKREIENALRLAVDDAVLKWYGKNPDAVITRRIREEWHAMECTDTILDMVTLHSISMWLKENGYRYYLGYATGSSFIGYLLEIGSVNPLPPHLYCPSCYKIQWASEHFDGFDLPRDHVCSDDGTTLLCDGHKIPWQTLWGYDDYEPDFRIEVEERAYNDLLQFVRQHWLFREIQGEPALEEDHFKVKCVDILSTRIHFSIKENQIVNGFHEKVVDAAYADTVIDSWKRKMTCRRGDKFLMRSGSYADVFSLYGLSIASSKFKLEQYFMCNRMGYHPSDFISVRDDVFDYLTDHGFIPKDAWRGANSVRKGRGLPVITGEMNTAKDKYILSQCEQIKYLGSKAQVLEKIFYQWKLIT